MTVVWLVEYNHWDRCIPRGIFSTKEKAQEYVYKEVNQDPDLKNKLDIDEYVVDAES